MSECAKKELAVKKISTFSLVIVLLAAGFLPSWQAAARSNFFVPDVASTAAAVPVQNVHVVSLSQNSATVAVSSGAALAACQNPASASGNLVQDTGLIDLNQSANCFVLKPAVLPPSPKLSVEPLVRPLVSLAVQTTPTVLFTTMAAGAAPLLPDLPVLPLTGFSLVVVFELFDIKKLSKQALSKIPFFVPETNFVEFKVLRC